MFQSLFNKVAGLKAICERVLLNIYCPFTTVYLRVFVNLRYLNQNI